VSDRSKYSSALPPMNIEIRYGNNEPDLLSQSLTSLAGHSPLARLASTAAGKSHRESHGRPDATTLPEAASQQRFRPPLAPGALVDRPRVAAAGQIKPREPRRPHARRPQRDATTLRGATSPASLPPALPQGAPRRQAASAAVGQIKPREPRRQQPNATTLRGSASFAVSPGR
jgi:hypothetical protein